MGGAFDLAREIMTLTSNVNRLTADVDRLHDMVRDHANRIGKLENSSDLTVEKAKNAAMEQLVNIHAQMIDRVHLLEKRLKDVEASDLNIGRFSRYSDSRTLPRSNDSEDK